MVALARTAAGTISVQEAFFFLQRDTGLSVIGVVKLLLLVDSWRVMKA